VTGGAGAIGSAIANALRGDGLRAAVVDRADDITADRHRRVRRGPLLLPSLSATGAATCSCTAPRRLTNPTLPTSMRLRGAVSKLSTSIPLVAGPGLHPRDGRASIWPDRLRHLEHAVEAAHPLPLPYVASKGALVGIMLTLAVTLGLEGVADTGAPGLTDTPGSRTVNGDEQFDAAVNDQVLKRPLTPADTAAAVAFLASDGAAAMTGQVLCVDGGGCPSMRYAASPSRQRLWRRQTLFKK
jgi:3-oxoacyl-[acyl-carrier protein] reductase